MTTFEELFNSSVLNVIAPQASIGLPESVRDDTDNWLSQLQNTAIDRNIAFFGKGVLLPDDCFKSATKLEFLLTIRFASTDLPENDDPTHPPIQLLSFLTHLQISYDASYISSLPSTLSAYNVPENARPPVPPRTISMNHSRPNTNALSPHPSIFPPATPLPIPSSTESDRRYVQAQGTPLISGIWGETAVGPTANTSDAFILLWSSIERAWVAVYRMSVLVSFLRTNLTDPLLCLTVSATLREKALAITPARQPLAALIDDAGGLDQGLDLRSPINTNGEENESQAGLMDLTGLEEVNLFASLATGPTFSSKSEISVSLPSSRIGSSTRHQAFSLPPVSPTPVPVTSPTSSIYRSHPTLRKSFRKTLRTVSGFRVRMRTVFVPYFLLPSRKGTNTVEREQREAGNEEHTVILCVEVENVAESDAGFAVESVDVSVGGEGAQTLLIGWGQWGLVQPERVFPLLIGPNEQYNVLYAVSFLRSPEADEFSLAQGAGTPSAGPSNEDLQRAVAININGRPYEKLEDQEELQYPTQTYPSRWNCVLDLSTAGSRNSVQSSDSSGFDGGLHDAMPTPASPFPTSSHPTFGSGTVIPATPPFISRTSTPSPAVAVAGSKRHTLTALTSPINYRSSIAMLNPANQRDTQLQTSAQGLTQSQTQPSTPTNNRASYLPPSIAFQSSYTRSPTTYGPSPPPSRGVGLGHIQEDSLSSAISVEQYVVPPTPAYPAYPSSPIPPTPHWQGPFANMQSAVGPSVEIGRERGAMSGVPPTPGPRIAGGFSQAQAQLGADTVGFRDSESRGEPIVVSVGLLPTGDDEMLEGKIFPLDRFTLDIFVFNQSGWTRRFEVSYPDERRRRKGPGVLDEGQKKGSVGILPLENRVRIGPLLPSTCQSVRMDFLALAPGVHSIDLLTLSDIQTGHTVNLRSVIDIVVHDPSLIKTDHL